MAKAVAMSRLEDALAALLRNLAGAPLALVGGLAVSVHTEPRFTRDVDVAVAVASDAEAEAIVRALTGTGYRVLTVVEHETQHRLATARLGTPSGTEAGVVVDLLFASSGIEPEIVEQAETLDVFAGMIVPVARVGHLAVLKLLSSDARTRPHDAADLRALRAVASAPELTRAEISARLVETRGFARGRDLARAVAEWISSESDS